MTIKVFSRAVFVAATVAASPVFSAVNQRCDKLFEVLDTLASSPANSTSAQATTRGFIELVEELLNRNILTQAEFRAFANEVNSNRLVNPISARLAVHDSSRAVFRTALDQLLFQSTQPDIGGLKSWAALRLEQFAQTDTERQWSESVTRESHVTMKFNFVSRGSFRLREAPFRPRIEVTLTHDFEVMETLVTQYHWTSLMGNNPSFKEFLDNPNGIWEYRDFDNNSVRLLPDHPVTHMTWWSVLVFANEYSKKNNLKPVYDLKDIAFTGSFPDREPQNQGIVTDADLLEAAANGSLRSIDPGVYPKIHAPDGDPYRAEGFRLLTDAEHLYLRLLGGTHDCTELQFRGKNLNAYRRIAWPHDRSLNSNYVVASRGGQKIGQSVFYDLWGNVPEWTFDLFLAIPTSGINPLSKNDQDGFNHRRVIWVGITTNGIDGREIFSFPTYEFLVLGRERGDINESRNTGFRLGRTLNVYHGSSTLR